MTTLNIAMAQLNLLVGDIEGNCNLMLEYAQKAKAMGADIVAFPELSLTGYPPEDLLLRPALYTRIAAALKKLCEQSDDLVMIVGYPEKVKRLCYNQLAVIQDGKIQTTYHKQRLPNYRVFDEKRYFKQGNQSCVINIKDVNIGLLICEDIWRAEPIKKVVHAGAEIILTINASPFYSEKSEDREALARKNARKYGKPIIYVNCVGGQDELLFDGGSMAVDSNGSVCNHAGFYEENLTVVSINKTGNNITLPVQSVTPKMSIEERIYKAIVLGVRDYAHKNNFKQALLGLSGGIDSALTLCIAVDALGAQNVHCLFMPSEFTSDMSIEDATKQVTNLGVTYSSLPIHQTFSAFMDTLKDAFANKPADITEENLQARCRGTLLMAMSNKTGALVLSTGNKSELSVGYTTLYGDMVGGFCVLKDVPKTLVYKLAAYRNKIDTVIPKRVIDRPASAELAHNQTDQDTLPPYDILDKILYHYIAEDLSLDNIVAKGFDHDTVKKVIHLVDNNEYKRRQSPPGVRISQHAFGRDRRYPITSGYNTNLLTE